MTPVITPVHKSAATRATILFQLRNLRYARKMWETIPEKNVVKNLNTWVKNQYPVRAPDCGTIACFGGWVALMPRFVRFGVKRAVDGAPHTNWGPKLHPLLHRHSEAMQVAEDLFGSGALFSPRGADHMACNFDKDAMIFRGDSDKHAVLMRINHQIDILTDKLKRAA